MDKIKVTYRGSRYHNNGWIVGSVKINQIIETQDSSEIHRISKNNLLLAVRGDVGFEPILNAEYKMSGELVKDDKWGLQFDIISMTEIIKLDSEEDKKYFLQQILTENQINELYKKYDDPFILLENADIPSLMKVHGIGDVMAEKLINRFNSTVDNAPAFIYFKKFEITNNLVNKLIKTYGGATQSIKAFKDNPYILIDDVDGIGFIKADEIALKSGINEESPLRIEQGILHIFKQAATNNGHTWISPNNFRSGIVKLLNINFDIIKPILMQMKNNNIIYIHNDKKKISLQEYYDLETKISNKILSMIGNSIEYNNQNIKNKIKEIELEQNFEFTEEQKDAIFISSQNNVMVLTGSAGTGKSVTAKGIIRIMPDNYNIALTALSGQASKRLSDASGYPSSTIHRLLGYNPQSGFNYDESNQLPYDVIILDECSMIPIDLFWCLIRSLKDNAKLIMLGDIKQLPPIGIGNLFNDLLKAENIPKKVLTKIHRQAAKSAIITCSKDISERKQIVEINEDGDKTLGELQDLTICSYQDKNILFDKTIDIFKNEYNKNSNIKNIQVIVPMIERGNLSQLAFNNKIQSIVNPGDKKFIKIGKKYIIKEGDKVINRKNNYNVFDINYKSASVFNGSMGIVESIKDDCMIINFDGIGKLRIKEDSYNGIQLAYAVTSHSYQGSQVKTAIVVLDYSAYALLSREWVYTSLTRAQDNCYLVCETKALRYATIQSSIRLKNTFLQELLEKGVNNE